MKKVVVVSGSKRKGNTLGIANIYISEFDKRGYETKLIDLSSLTLNFCDGCLECEKPEHLCKIDDGFEKIISDLKAADLVIFGTPTRWNLLSGELKCFIERLNPCAAIDGYVDKNVFIYALGMCGEEDKESIDYAINSVRIFAEQAQMNILGTQAFLNLCGAEDYLDNADALREICADNVEMLCEKIK